MYYSVCCWLGKSGYATGYDCRTVEICEQALALLFKPRPVSECIEQCPIVLLHVASLEYAQECHRLPAPGLAPATPELHQADASRLTTPAARHRLIITPVPTRCNTRLTTSHCAHRSEWQSAPSSSLSGAHA
nr:hypothetical protein CFP56_11738 [Quercus suber]